MEKVEDIREEETKGEGIKSYYISKIEEHEQAIRESKQNLARLEAQRNETNNAGDLIFPILLSIITSYIFMCG